MKKRMRIADMEPGILFRYNKNNYLRVKFPGQGGPCVIRLWDCLNITPGDGILNFERQAEVIGRIHPNGKYVEVKP